MQLFFESTIALGLVSSVYFCVALSTGQLPLRVRHFLQRGEPRNGVTHRFKSPNPVRIVFCYARASLAG
jgi:hypothetical protein